VASSLKFIHPVKSYCVNVFSVRLSVVRLSVTFVHPTQTIEIFGNISTPFGTLTIYDLSVKTSRRSSQETPPSGS